MSSTPFAVGAYVGSFDPMTNGHLDIIQRASQLFQHLVIGIGSNSQKTPFLPLAERLSCLRAVCAAVNPNIEVQEFSGLAINFAQSVGAKVLVRGLRTESDYVFEMQMALMNRALTTEIDTIFIPTSQELSHISSSMIKEVAILGGDVSKFVPPQVAPLLMAKRRSIPSPAPAK